MKTFAIGDIHNHYTELMGLFDTLHKDAGLVDDRDTVIFLGDYIDGGPDGKKVLDWCMEKDAQHENWIFLKGNHEDLLLDALLYNSRIYHNYYLWYMQGGKETLDSFTRGSVYTPYQKSIMQPTDIIGVDYLSWLHGRPLMHEDEKHYFVHAGFRPEIPVEDQDRMDMLWIRDEFIDSDYDFGKTVVYGHTASKEPQIGVNKLCIDTMYHDRGRLTAVELGKNWKFYQQVAGKGEI